MALAPYEVWRRGFVVEISSNSPVLTTITTGATDRGGFLRDPDGRLVVKVV